MKTRLSHIQNWSVLAQASNWSALTLAKQCGVSLRTLERYFLKEMGKTPKVWLVDQRQRQAAKLFQHGSSVKETAYGLGYKHVAHFSRDFKEFWGNSPTTRPAQLQ
jgi:AraC-like DNA-binding protein